MSIQDRATAAALLQLSTAADGALIGLGVAYLAYCCVRKLGATKSALGKIREAPSTEPSDLRSVLSGGDGSSSSSQTEGDSSSSSSDGGKLVIVRGSVAVKSAAEKGNWKSLLRADLVSSQESGEEGVILQRSHSCVYNELKGILGLTAEIRSMFSRSWKVRESSSVRMVPFILVDGGKWPESDYLVVNMEGSKHPLPLTTVHRDLQPLNASPSTFLQALFGLEYPVGLLYEEKILPLGKDITAVGVCSLKNGIPEIKSCQDLPYFLSDLNKDQIIEELTFTSQVLMWSGLIFGSLAIGILGYSVARNWLKWKERRRQRRLQQEDNNSTSSPAAADVAPEEPGEVPDGELCVVCLMRRRRSAFIPCGHLVCCQRCALAVEREALPKCPVCRQAIRGSVRIYES